ncbi:DNA-3-methyladenine glycosylase [uncultured Agathobaculum sp.]|uniref:DNA-3-methyladenine glycosylase family protein n=1 Tax=uncultured Agathobaculum sp. TaxID=2048140 RepID=UPI00320A2CF3
MEKKYFAYGKTETDYLTERDPVLGAAIARIGHIDREVIPNLFTALVNSIAGQQISGKALATVWARLCDRLGEITPETILAAGEDGLRACGMSGRKAGYMLAAAHAVQDGTINIHSLVDKSDDEIIKTLTALPGVGRWTAEMLLIFSLERPDVLAFDDFGIRKGLCRLYGLEELTRVQFEEYRARYAPYATVAGLYLWEVAAQKKDG